jgi:hypothetical protein
MVHALGVGVAAVVALVATVPGGVGVGAVALAACASLAVCAEPLSLGGEGGDSSLQLLQLGAPRAATAKKIACERVRDMRLRLRLWGAEDARASGSERIGSARVRGEERGISRARALS